VEQFLLPQWLVVVVAHIKLLAQQTDSLEALVVAAAGFTQPLEVLQHLVRAMLVVAEQFQA
jgi:hypothetical protein